MIIATGTSRLATSWRREQITWEQLCAKLSRPIRTRETQSEYRALSKEQQSLCKDVGGFVGGEVIGGRRKAGSVQSRWLVTLDADNWILGDFDVIWDLQDGEYTMCVYSTHSHTQNKPRLRYVLPLKRAVTPDEYGAVARAVAKRLGIIETLDVTTYQPERLMYWPSVSADGEYIFRISDGCTIDPDEILRSYGIGDAWHDTSLWPRSSSEDTILIRQQQTQQDPETKGGMVGAFCRAYDVTAAIAEFLCDVYSPCEAFGGQRYTYVPGSTAAGAVVYDSGKWLFSNHATDPAGGQLCNAFDLVRIHLFGERDEDYSPRQGDRADDRPSYKAMCEFAAELPEVKAILCTEAQERASSDFTDLATMDNNPWYTQLKLNTRTGQVERLMANAELIIRNDPQLQGLVAYNEFTGRVCITRDAPWRKLKTDVLGYDNWTDVDDYQLQLYFERAYAFRGETDILKALAISAEANPYHPVRSYLQSLVWDGTERLDTLLIRYFDADDTALVRAYTRKWMCAAVARAINPGCKFDCMLVLNGSQGIGKSQFGNIISRGWFSDSLSCIEDSKGSYEQLRGKWIIEMAELAALRRSEDNRLKQFISASSDSYRPAYGRNIVDYPRQCVFIGSTNDHDYLRDPTGNRRYWTVDCHTTDARKLSKLPAEIDQIWAEAVVCYYAGEQLFLSEDLAEMQTADAEQHTTESELEGELREYLDRKLPDDWYAWDEQRRRDYVQGYSLTESAQCTLTRTRVCVTEILAELCGLSKTERARGKTQGTEYKRLLQTRFSSQWRKMPRKAWFGIYGQQWGYERYDG